MRTGAWRDKAQIILSQIFPKVHFCLLRRWTQPVIEFAKQVPPHTLLHLAFICLPSLPHITHLTTTVSLNEREAPEEEANMLTLSEVEGTVPSEAASSGKQHPHATSLMAGALPAHNMAGLFKVGSGEAV